jgi:glutathione S-transferase
MIIRLRSPQWLAGETFTITDGVVTRAPARLAHLEGVYADWLRDYFRVMKWTAAIVRDAATAPAQPSAPTPTDAQG